MRIKGWINCFIIAGYNHKSLRMCVPCMSRPHPFQCSINISKIQILFKKQRNGCIFSRGWKPVGYFQRVEVPYTPWLMRGSISKLQGGMSWDMHWRKRYCPEGMPLAQNPVLTNRNGIWGHETRISKHIIVMSKEYKHRFMVDAAGIGGRKKLLPGEISQNNVRSQQRS